MIITLKNKDTLVCNDFKFKCCIGQKGLTYEKKEGDRKTPKGIFSLGPLHVQKHLDGYNHFYEFYQFPVRASGTQNLYNDNNRRMINRWVWISCRKFASLKGPI